MAISSGNAGYFENGRNQTCKFPTAHNLKVAGLNPAFRKGAQSKIGTMSNSPVLRGPTINLIDDLEQYHLVRDPDGAFRLIEFNRSKYVRYLTIVPRIGDNLGD